VALRRPLVEVAGRGLWLWGQRRSGGRSADPAFRGEEVRRPGEQQPGWIRDGSGDAHGGEGCDPWGEGEEEQGEREAAEHPVAVACDVATPDLVEADGGGHEPQHCGGDEQRAREMADIES